jgi:hypothetical protein
MEKQTSKKKMNIQILKKSELISDTKGNNIQISRQAVIQDDGRTSEHIVVERYKTTSTGVPSSRPTSLWIPVTLVSDVITKIQNLSD